MGESSVIAFPAADGTPLRGRLRCARAQTPAGAAILTHPHPEFGGNMDVWLLPRLAERLQQEGWTTLRFDFRPGAAADPEHGHPAARADLAGAVEYLVTSTGDRPRQLALVGWSFGALIALLHAQADPRIDHWIGISPPTESLPSPRMAAIPQNVEAHARRTVIVGEHDQFFPPATAERLRPHEVIVLHGADHFLFDHDHEVADAVARALADGSRHGPEETS